MVNIFFFFMVFLCFLKFILNYNHLLVSLLCLEFLSLLFFMGVSGVFFLSNMEPVYMLYFLVMVVSEGVLGLCLLILLSFCYGDDYFSSHTTLMC
uniref:NADH dehydrogenase subunit 4L n=1 Tax=Caprella scaura TaxID=703580 RepID=E2RVN5_9CRUS|nr:NADH dehydrogenase subunit 4L [Caprella scaura]BAJ23209.1 NADH dehydrogenase subunit 4L [Caprella scaura]